MRLFLLLAVLLAAPAATAQPTPNATGNAEGEAAEVRATIDALFDAMRAADSTGVRAVFTESARLQTAQVDGDSTRIQTTPIARFASAVGQPKDEVWDERVWDVQVRTDGPMATAWVPYAFYLGDELSHCGVNAIHFVLHSGGWKIHSLLDTRHPGTSCDLPASVTSR